MKTWRSVVPAVLILIGSASASWAQSTWTYDFRTGLDPYYWTFESSGSTTWTTSGAVSGLQLVGSAGGGGLSAGTISLNLGRFAPIGDFDASLTFADGVFGPNSSHQLHFGVSIDGSGIYAVRSNETDGLHMWLGSYVDGPTGSSATSATLRLTRVGTTVSAFIDGNSSPFWSGTYTTSAPTWIGFNMMKNGTDDFSAVTWQSFSISPSPIPEPAAAAAIVASAALALVVWHRRRTEAFRG